MIANDIAIKMNTTSLIGAASDISPHHGGGFGLEQAGVHFPGPCIVVFLR